MKYNSNLIELQHWEFQFSSVQFSSVAQSCPTLCDPMDCSTPGLPVQNQLPEFTQTLVHHISDAFQPSHPRLSLSTPAFNLSHIKAFSNESVLPIRWLKYWSFSFSISPYNEYSGLISFRMDWLDLLAIQGTLKSLLQQKHQIACAQLSLWSNSHIQTWLWEKSKLWLDRPLLAK